MSTQERGLPNGKDLAEAISQSIIEGKLLGFLGSYFTRNLIVELEHAQNNAEREQIIINQATHFQTSFDGISHGKISLETVEEMAERQKQYYATEVTTLASNPEAFKQTLSAEDQRARWEHAHQVIQKAQTLRRNEPSS